MKSSLVQIVALVFGTVLAAALQDLLPAWGGVKLPIVTAAVAFTAFRAPLVPALFTGFAAGMLLDALSGVSSFGAAVSMPLVALGSHFLRSTVEELPQTAAGALVTAAAAAFGEIWLAASGFASGDAGLLVRLTISVFLAAPAGAVLFAMLPSVGRHIGLGEEATAR